jgi:hypothetical protein
MTPTFRRQARLVLLSLVLACGARAQAQEAVTPAAPLTLESSAIRGNQELPKVLYIVPWKDPAMAELAGRPVNSLVEEILAPVDREVFRRQTRYFSQLYGAGSAQSAAAVPGGPRDAASKSESN